MEKGYLQVQITFLVKLKQEVIVKIPSCPLG